MRENLRIKLGSASSRKLEAVRLACERLGLEVTISGMKTASGQNEQPVGLSEILAGAMTRAKAVKEQDSSSVAIGIANGLIILEDIGLNNVPDQSKASSGGAEKPETFDIAIIVVLGRNDKQIVVASSILGLPEDCVTIAKERGFEATTVGSVIAEKFGGDPTDPHSILTGGKKTRTIVLTDALVGALKRL